MDLRIIYKRPSDHQKVQHYLSRKMILGYVIPVELETVQLSNVKTVIHLEDLKDDKMKLSLLPLICQTVSVYLINNIVKFCSNQ